MQQNLVSHAASQSRKYVQAKASDYGLSLALTTPAPTKKIFYKNNFKILKIYIFRQYMHCRY
jgi:hypothetical protein